MKEHADMETNDERKTEGRLQPMRSLLEEDDWRAGLEAEGPFRVVTLNGRSGLQAGSMASRLVLADHPLARDEAP